MSDIRKTFLGYDLGDGESITDCVTLSQDQTKHGLQVVWKDMKMPGIKDPGKAVPTAYAYDRNGRTVFAGAITLMPDMVHDIHANFKRRPTDLIPGMDLKKEIELKELFTKAQGWPARADCNTTEMTNFRNAVVTFTDAIFNAEDFKDALRSEAANSDEIVFNIGHPTRWSELDALIYKQILKGSVIGKGKYADKKASLDVAAESRAAFLAVRDKTTEAVLPKGTSALLIDTGSSTVDLTALSANSHNYQYNSGSNYLGVRSIDFALRELYLERLAQYPDQFRAYQQMAQQNPTVEVAATLAARRAKEELYSTDSPLAMITLGQSMPIRIMADELEELIARKPVADLLRKYSKVPEAELQKMGSKSWEKLFEEFLTEQKDAISRDSRKLRIGRIIMTGSATRMPVVSRVVKKVFSELPADAILKDMDPSRSISKGLALVGVNEEKTNAFDKDVHAVIKTSVPQIVRDNVPALAEKLTPIIYAEVQKVIFESAGLWRNGTITTLSDMTSRITRECTQENLNVRLEKNEQYKKCISQWCEDVVGPDVAIKLKAICDQYGVKGVSLDSLNVLRISGISSGGIAFGGELAQMIIDAVAAITAVISLTIVPVIAYLIAVIALALEIDVIIIVAAFLVTTPVGWACLVGLVGASVAALVKNGMNGRVKDVLVEKLQNANIPVIFRKVLSDKKLESELVKANMHGQIREKLVADETKDELASKISTSLEAQINKRMEDIKYMIQSE